MWIWADEGRQVDMHPERGRAGGARRAAPVPELAPEVAEELDALHMEMMELRQANEILLAASAHFAAPLDRTGRASWSSLPSTGTRSGSSRHSGS